MTESPAPLNPSKLNIDNRCLSVVMPVYNEAATIRQIIGAVLVQPAVAELVVVDDCTSDGTWESLNGLRAENPRMVLHRHETNRGKGAAVRTGISMATAPIVLIQDADLEYDPAEYQKMLQPILDGR